MEVKDTDAFLLININSCAAQKSGGGISHCPVFFTGHFGNLLVFDGFRSASVVLPTPSGANLSRVEPSTTVVNGTICSIPIQ